MIKVNVRLLPTKSSAIDNITIHGCNMITKGVAEKLQKAWGNKECETHPNHNCVIVLKAIDGESPKMIKEDFCCKEFSEKFELKIS